MPTAGPGEALIRVRAVGICGSDLHYFEEGRIGSNVVKGPLVLGHEYAGEVEGVGPGVPKSLVGARVAVEPGAPCGSCEWCGEGDYNVCPDMTFPGGPPHDGALCDYVVVPYDKCFPIPDSMDMETAATIEPLAVALHTVQLAQFRPGDTCAVLGLGPIGLLCGMVAKQSGARLVYGTDPESYRREAALACGFDGVYAADGSEVAAVFDTTGGRGVDVGIDAARSSLTMGLACRMTRPNGRCVLTGISGEEEDPLPVSVARRRELKLTWCRRFKHDYPRGIAMVDSGALNLEPVLTHTFPLEATQEAFEVVSSRTRGVLKATVML